MSPPTVSRLAAGAAAIVAAASACDRGPVEPVSQPPTVVITLPAPASVLMDADSILVEGTARDDGRIVRLVLRLGGVAIRSPAFEPGPEVGFREVVRDLPLGDVVIEVQAYDDEGALGWAAVNVVTRDGTSPRLRILSPSPGDVTGRDSTFVSVIVSDARGIASLTYALDGGATTSLPVGADSLAAFVLRPEPGIHRLRVEARDASGNIGIAHGEFVTAAAELSIAGYHPHGPPLAAFVTQLDVSLEPTLSVRRWTVQVGGGAEVVRWDQATSAGLPPMLVADSLRQGDNAITVTAYGEAMVPIGRVRTQVHVAVPTRPYQLHYLGTLGGVDSRGFDINEIGQVAGWAQDAQGALRAVVWNGARWHDISAGLGTTSAATAINDSGIVVGAFTGECAGQAFEHRFGSGATTRLMSECNTEVLDVNEAGTVLLFHRGPPTDACPGWCGWLLDAAGRHAIVPPAFGGQPRFLNDRRDVLGTMIGGPADVRAAFFQVEGEPFDPPDVPAVTLLCYPTDLDDMGRVAMRYGCKSWQIRNGTVAGRTVGAIGYPAFEGVYGRAWEMTHAEGMNNREQGVGLYALSRRPAGDGTLAYVMRPFLWDGTRSLAVEHDQPAWELDVVIDLNDAGVILGHGVNHTTGQRGAVLLVPRS